MGTYKIFTRANAYWKQQGKKEVFNIQLAGLSRKVEFYEGIFEVKPHTTVSAISKTDLIIIPSLNHNYEKALKANEPLVTWISRQYQDGAPVAAICTGAFLLASTGLLDGKSCSTHWSAADNFRITGRDSFVICLHSRALRRPDCCAR